MSYIVIEFQSGETGTALVQGFETLTDAEYKFHDILKYATISTVAKHGAIILNDDGEVIQAELGYRADPADMSTLYYVIELQGSTALVDTYSTYPLALQKYYMTMSYAAVSSVPKHGSIIITSDLFVMKKELAYRDAVEPEEEPEQPVEPAEEPEGESEQPAEEP